LKKGVGRSAYRPTNFTLRGVQSSKVLVNGGGGLRPIGETIQKQKCHVRGKNTPSGKVVTAITPTVNPTWEEEVVKKDRRQWKQGTTQKKGASKAAARRRGCLPCAAKFITSGGEKLVVKGGRKNGPEWIEIFAH